MSFPISFAEFAGMALSISSAFHGFAHWAAPAAVAGLWQGAVVAAALAVCLRLAPRVSAAHRFVAWAAGFVVAAGLPALPIVMHMLLTSGTAQGPVAAAGSADAWFTLGAHWSLAIAGLWVGLSAYRGLGLAIHSLRLRKLWKSARPISAQTMGDHSVSSFAPGLLETRRVEICSTSELDRPSVIGFFAPRILIPEFLLERLTREELEQVILHEAEHLRRGDDWTNLAQKLCLAAFPLNPALVWMDRRLSKEREMACDEGVVRVTGAPRAYAACLASLAERGLENRVSRNFGRRAEALSLGAFERRPELVHRVHRILGGRMMSPVAGRALVGVVGCGLLFGSVELARCPQAVAFVQEPSPAATMAKATPHETARRVPANYAVVRGNEGFRAVNAVAMVPARPDWASGNRIGAARAMLEHRQAAPALKTAADTSAARPRETLLKARAEAAAKQPQEWLVVTTWQVQTTFRARNVADYDDDQGDDGQSADGQATDLNTAANTTANEAMADPGSQDRTAKTRTPVANMAVTRMFLTVYRASQAASQAVQTGAQEQSASQKTEPMAGKTASPAAADAGLKSTELKSPADQPAARTLRAVPFGNGWLVIQL